MSPRMMTCRQAIEQERHKWIPFRRALSEEDQKAFDRMFAWAKQQLQTEVRLGRPCGFEAVLMAVLLAHKRRLEQLLRQLEKRHGVGVNGLSSDLQEGS